MNLHDKNITWNCDGKIAVAVNPFEEITPTGEEIIATEDLIQWDDFDNWSSDPANQPRTSLTGTFKGDEVEVKEVWEYSFDAIDWNLVLPECYLRMDNNFDTYSEICKQECFETRQSFELILKPMTDQNKPHLPISERLGDSIQHLPHVQNNAKDYFTKHWYSEEKPYVQCEPVIEGYCQGYQDGANWQASKMYSEEQVLDLLEWMKKKCASEAAMLFHDGHTKQNTELLYFQSGADNLQPNKQSILSIDPQQFINELKNKI